MALYVIRHYSHHVVLLLYISILIKMHYLLASASKLPIEWLFDR